MKFDKALFQDMHGLRPGPKPRHVLVVEDDRTMRMFIEQQLRGLGYETVGAACGASARELLESSPDVADVILLDKSLPGIDGAELARSFRHSPVLSQKPVIMLTGSGNAQDIASGVDLGVFYYLVKPVDIAVLQSVVASAFRQAESRNRLFRQIDACKSAMALVQSAKFTFRTPDDVGALATLLSSAFPNPARAVVGISELMLNAIEHGNLEIGQARKALLMESETFADEVARRLELPEYQKRVARAVVTRMDGGIYVVVSDDGAGFNPKPYLSLDPSRAMSKSGRGIAQARVVSFDKLAYNAAGNQVIGFVSVQETLDW